MCKNATCLLLVFCFTSTRSNSAAEDEGFVSIFNGQDLAGWDGKPGWWRVEDGALTAQSTPEKPCAKALLEAHRHAANAQPRTALDGYSPAQMFLVSPRLQMDRPTRSAIFHSLHAQAGCIVAYMKPLDQGTLRCHSELRKKIGQTSDQPLSPTSPPTV